MKDNLSAIFVGVIIIIALFIAHIGQHPESPAAEWLHNSVKPAIKNTATDIIKSIPFSGLLRID